MTNDLNEDKNSYSSIRNIVSLLTSVTEKNPKTLSPNNFL